MNPHVRTNLPQLLSFFLIIILAHRLSGDLRALTHQWRDLELLRKLMMLLTLYLFDETWILVVWVHICVLLRLFYDWTDVLLQTSTIFTDILQAKFPPRRLRKLRACRP